MGDGFREFVRTIGLDFYENWQVPGATQILRLSNFPAVPRVGYGDLPGSLPMGSLAQVEVSEVHGGIITAVIVAIPETIVFASRLVCHDRSLGRDLLEDPEASVDTIELSDRNEVFESVAFFERYAVVADHDQDRISVWQLFSPELIDFLADDAPRGFSFEVQQGGLTCFVPEASFDPELLSALCDASARIFDRVVEMAAADEALGAAGAKSRRDSLIDRELAEHPFSEAPASVRRAGLHLGVSGVLTPGGRRLAKEAFFRSYADAIGFEPVTEAQFRARHQNECVIGAITHVARGLPDDVGHECWLVLSRVNWSEQWITLIVDTGALNNYAFAGLPETEQAKEKGLEVTGADDAVYFFMAKRPSSKKALDGFMSVARPLAVTVMREAERLAVGGAR